MMSHGGVLEAQRHVSSRPGLPQITVEQATQLLRLYHLKAEALWAIPRGTISQNYCVRTDGGNFFMRLSQPRPAGDIQFEAELIWFLGSRGLCVPPIIRTRTGLPFAPVPREIATYPGQHVMLFSWITGKEVNDEELTSDEAHVLGQALAQLHLVTADFPHKRPSRYGPAQIAARLAHLQSGPVEAGLQPVLDELLAESQRPRGAVSSLPSGICHGDLFPDNLLLQRRAPSLAQPGVWIFDFEQAASLPYVVDVAVALLACCAPAPQFSPGDIAGHAAAHADDLVRVGPLELPQSRAFLSGYQSYRALAPAELSALPEQLRLSALRFAVTRLTDVYLPRAAGMAQAQDAGAKKGPLPAYLAHSKDYRDYLWRLRMLSALAPAELARLYE